MMHADDRFANEGWFFCDKVIIWMCCQRFACLLAKQRTTFKWQDTIYGFIVSPSRSTS